MYVIVAIEVVYGTFDSEDEAIAWAKSQPWSMIAWKVRNINKAA